MTSYYQKYRTDSDYNNNKCAKLHENSGQSFCSSSSADCCSNCYYDFNLCGIFENMTSFTPILNEELEQGKLMAALNSWKCSSKNAPYTVPKRSKVGKVSRKDLLCMKM